MSTHFLSANGDRAMRVARKLVKPLDWGDLESVVYDSMDDQDELFKALDADYVKNEKRRHELWDALSERFGQDVEGKKLLNDLSDLIVYQETTKLKGWFQLGYATALRLLGTPPPLEVIPAAIGQRS